MPVLRRADETPAARKKEPFPSRGQPEIMIAFQPAGTFDSVRADPTIATAGAGVADGVGEGVLAGVKSRG